MGKYYFLMSLIPPLPSVLGEKSPFPFSEISRIVRRNIEPEDAPLTESLLLAVDVTNFENLHQGRPLFIEGGILTQEEIERKRNLPLFIQAFLEEKDRGIRRPYVFDALWERYYSYAYTLAQERDCRFLADYLAWEIGLRNQLVMMRAKEKGVEAGDYFILPQAGTRDLSALVTQVKSQKNPLMAERLIDEERLKAIFHCEGGDPFSINAVLALLAKASLFSRWEKMTIPYEVRGILDRR
jgi:hypothetical protein